MRAGRKMAGRSAGTSMHEVPIVGLDTPHALWKEDLIAALLSATLIIGLFLDGWNHINILHGRLGTFFTPWHAMLYAGFAAAAAWVLTRNPHLYLRGRPTKPEFYRLFGIPLRYPFAVAGLGLATVALAGTSSGMLFCGGAALVAGALRSGWHAPRHYPAIIGFRQFLPPLISLTLLTALGSFMFQWLSAFMDWQPSVNFGRDQVLIGALPSVEGTVEIASVARIVVTNLLLLGPVLLAMRRWRLPFGSVTALFTTVAVGMAALTNFHLAATIAAVTAGGLAADLLIYGLAPSPAKSLAYRIVAGVVPLVMWTAYFLLLRAAYGIRWPFDLWLAAVGLTAVTGLALSFLAVPPTIPRGVWAPSSLPEAEVAGEPPIPTEAIGSSSEPS